MKQYRDIEEIKQTCPSFFGKGAMKGFHSRIHEKVYYGCLFITSETYETGTTRYYHVRECIDGNITTINSFMQDSKYIALKKMHAYAQEKGYEDV